MPRRLTAVSAVLLFLLILPLPAPARGPRRLLCGPSWTSVPAPQASPNDGLWAVAAVSSNDVWAVGSSGHAQPFGGPLAEHWDGAAWSIVHVPGTSLLGAIDATAADDVWAVGNLPPAILHWNGTGWTRMSIPPLEQGDLRGISAIASDDVWVVGEYRPLGGLHVHTLAMHWDGTLWAIVPTPNPGPGPHSLAAVDASASNDVWAVGSKHSDPLIVHWDGTRWQPVPSHIPRMNGNLEAVSVHTAGDVWAFGGAYYQSESSAAQRFEPITDHWDGSVWAPVRTTDRRPHTTLFSGAVGPDDAWAVGQSYEVKPPGTINDAVSQRWDGATWLPVNMEHYRGHIEQATGLARTPSGELWAVGIVGVSRNPPRTVPLLEHICPAA
jgi:hypothetical protein